MSKEVLFIFSFLMILNVNTYANIILERSLRANEGHIGIYESLLYGYNRTRALIGCWAGIIFL